MNVGARKIRAVGRIAGAALDKGAPIQESRLDLDILRADGGGQGGQGQEEQRAPLHDPDLNAEVPERGTGSAAHTGRKLYGDLANRSKIATFCKKGCP